MGGGVVVLVLLLHASLPHRTSIPTVIVSLTTHDNMYVHIFVHVHVHVFVHGYMDIWVF